LRSVEREYEIREHVSYIFATNTSLVVASRVKVRNSEKYKARLPVDPHP